MRRIKVIGIGMGEPGHLTGDALAALHAAEVVFTLDKGPAARTLVARREALLQAVAPGRHRLVAAPDPVRDRTGDYGAGVEAWHAARATLYARLIAADIPEGGCGAILVWGDPALYDSTLRILDRVRRLLPLAVDVVPGLSAPQILAARHGIVLNDIGGSVLITTGRRLAADGWPPGADSVVVMLDGEEAFGHIDAEGLEIVWGAYLGTPDEILVAGPLSRVAETIRRERRAARARLGWIMDTYLLRRRG